VITGSDYRTKPLRPHPAAAKILIAHGWRHTGPPGTLSQNEATFSGDHKGPACRRDVEGGAA